MSGEGGRLARAGNYVLGLMNDAERERAERDLEIDPAFRDAVVQLADRLHLFDRADAVDGRSGDRWKLVAGRVAYLPHLRRAGLDRSDAGRPTIRRARAPVGVGLHALPGGRALLIALGFAAAFALGYLAGRL